ncbi:MAG: patatin family protein [Clostridiales Family XIII bacterium]|jgi:predicted patatin/cPLA2 family phospholipase|nr:patatin family protein [Clostridiales Family XIII bacterium]
MIAPVQHDLAPNITDAALIFEGGGMRASYTAGALVTLLEAGLHFSDVYGISAGSSHTVNYLSRDIWRARASFTDFMATPGTSGWGLLLRGKGYFNAHYIYEEACLPGGLLPYDFTTFSNNKARAHIEAYCYETGETAYFTSSDMPTLLDLMRRVRASSTMPFFMPPVQLDGRTYYDGGLGDSWGIPLAQAKRDGYERFFIVRTQPRGYRKSPDRHPALTRALFAGRPRVAERMLERWKRYNAILDEIDALEREGRATVFCPEEMSVKNTTTDLVALRAAYEKGYAQARRALPAWETWLAG